MNGALPAQVLQCPDPAGCGVAKAKLASLADLGRVPSARLPATRVWVRVYDGNDGFNTPNPGHGNTRFAPFDDASSGARVPTMHLAETLTAALLETAFHDVHLQQPRVVSEMSFRSKLYAQLAAPRELFLADLRDDSLSALVLTREHLSNTPAEHYPCTRSIAQAVHASRQAFDGIIWHSRQAELSGKGSHEVAIVFADRVPHSRGAWTLPGYGSPLGSLIHGPGRLELDSIAESLDVTVVQ